MLTAQLGTVRSAAATRSQRDVLAKAGGAIRDRRRPRFNAGRVARRGGYADDRRGEINSAHGGAS